MDTDLGDPSLYAQGMPYDLFAELRRKGPVHWNPPAQDRGGFWAVLGFEEILAVSKQSDVFSSARENGGHRIFDENEAGLAGSGDSGIGVPFISRDPPIHTQYRKFVVPALSPGRLAGIETRIAARVEALLAEVPLNEAVDILPRFSVPLPLLTLAELLGVPGDMWCDLHRWTDAFIGEDDPDFRQSPEEMQQVVGEFFGFCQALFESRRAEPTRDLASLLANSEIGGQPVPFPDFVGNLVLALVGGNETTRNTLNHSMIAFARDPAQWQMIRDNPDLLPNAVKEMVRHASAVIHMRRTAMLDIELGGQAIRKGDRVVMFYPAGNRDAAVFADPGRFDVTRQVRQHVAFGAGVHVCVGSRLAEMQLRVAFGELVRHVSRFEIVGCPQRVRSAFINGFKKLEVRLVA